MSQNKKQKTPQEITTDLIFKFFKERKSLDLKVKPILIPSQSRVVTLAQASSHAASRHKKSVSFRLNKSLKDGSVSRLNLPTKNKGVNTPAWNSQGELNDYRTGSAQRTAPYSSSAQFKTIVNQLQHSSVHQQIENISRDVQMRFGFQNSRARSHQIILMKPNPLPKQQNYSNTIPNPPAQTRKHLTLSKVPVSPVTLTPYQQKSQSPIHGLVETSRVGANSMSVITTVSRMTNSSQGSGFRQPTAKEYEKSRILSLKESEGRKMLKQSILRLSIHKKLQFV